MGQRYHHITASSSVAQNEGPLLADIRRSSYGSCRPEQATRSKRHDRKPAAALTSPERLALGFLHDINF